MVGEKLNGYSIICSRSSRFALTLPFLEAKQTVKSLVILYFVSTELLTVLFHMHRPEIEENVKTCRTIDQELRLFDAMHCARERDLGVYIWR
jgi:hypothetical protein